MQMKIFWPQWNPDLSCIRKLFFTKKQLQHRQLHMIALNSRRTYGGRLIIHLINLYHVSVKALCHILILFSEQTSMSFTKRLDTTELRHTETGLKNPSVGHQGKWAMYIKSHSYHTSLGDICWISNEPIAASLISMANFFREITWFPMNNFCLTWKKSHNDNNNDL